MGHCAAIQEGSDVTELYNNLLAAIVFAVLGIVVYALSFIVLDRLTP